MGISMKTTSGKILASVALVGTAAAVAGMGTFGAFTDSTTAEQNVTAGTVNIDLGATASDTLNVAVAGLLPGDSVEKFVTLANSGNSALNNVMLSTTTADSSLLTTNKTDGLQLAIAACSVAWTAVANGADTCTGTTTSVLAATPVLVTDKALTGLASLTALATDHLKVTTSLPSSAGDTFQGLTSTINFTFAATQRTAEVK